MTETQRAHNIQAVKDWLQKANLDGILFTSEDAHHTEFSIDYYNFRKKIVGFDGSAGTLAFYRTSKESDYKVGLWVDGRYHLAAEKLLAKSSVRVFKMGLPGVLRPEQWIPSQLPKGGSFFIDGNSLNEMLYQQWLLLLNPHEVSLFTEMSRFASFPEFLPNAYQFKPIIRFASIFCGQTVEQKLTHLQELQQQLAPQSSSIILSQLDTIAWLLNLRGGDLPESSLFYALFYFSPHHRILYLKNRALSAEVENYLATNQIQVANYPERLEELQFPSSATIAFDPETTAHTLVQTFENHGIKPQIAPEFFSALLEYQAIRTPEEIHWVEIAHQIDAHALSLMQKEVFERLKRGRVCEWELGQLSHQCRAKAIEDLRGKLSLPPEAQYLCPSFEPIAAANENGAIVHYSPSEENSATFGFDEPVLLDNGGQYSFATTDMTRLFYFPNPNLSKRKQANPELVHDYTLVLKGHLALARITFPMGTTGLQLDTLARLYLWEEGKDFLHGTGHGVGLGLNVHEGPHSISIRGFKQPLLPGMVVTDEPGFYRAGHYGIRIENMVTVVEDEERSGFLKFKVLTLFPYDEELIDFKLLNEVEIKQVQEMAKRADAWL